MIISSHSWKQWLVAFSLIIISPFSPALGQVTNEAVSVGAPEYIEMEIGNENAAVTVTEYASLTCSHCARFHKDVYPLLKKNYIDTGKIKFQVREIYFDRHGLIATIVARCGGKEKYFPMLDRIFETQSEWSRMESLRAAAERLSSLARSMGITIEEFNQCIIDQENALLLIKTSKDFSKEFNISGTPTFVINGKTYSYMSYNEFSNILDDLL